MANRESHSPEAVAKAFKQLHEACDCVVNSCQRGRCNIVLPAVTECLDCDKCLAFAGRDGKKPDFILLHPQQPPTESLWCVVEMKSRAGHVSNIAQQLQAGADTLQSEPRFQFQKAPHHLRALVLHEKGIHFADLQILNSKRIQFAGKRWPIRVSGCPTSLTALM